MDINEIKKLISLTGGKYIIVENDKPQYVLMSFDDFCGMINVDKNTKNNSENKKQDINIVADNISNENEAIPVDLLDIKEDRLGEVRIEDLPF